ncbi:YIP1 family protein [Flavivirga eckloniae]|uniref:Yip1 domain-containing protein n=1 Tax=Flavivirga eckloniae TaxID=1803846 RepID=A0A2K9PME5_9FLAO|nr:YIP1 family protein [Flavivirga eckloniae]AUP78243.1 hypothetical protein C1H87_05715 [Flavivirga eckloniae]
MSDNTSKFDEFEKLKEFEALDLNNLLFEIWFKPKLVFTYLKKRAPTQYVQLLLIISALTTTFERVIPKNIGWDANGLGYFFGMLIFGAILTLGVYHFSAWFLHYFGRAFLNGNASTKDFRMVIAWSNIPIIASTILSILLLIIYGPNALSDNFFPTSETVRIVYITVAIIEIVIAIWSMVITVIGIMVIQNFNVGKAIGNVLLPMFLVILIFIIVFKIGGIL